MFKGSALENNKPRWYKENKNERFSNKRRMNENSSTIVATGRKHLEQLIDDAISENGLNCDLNHIDVSNIIDMAYLFEGSEFNGNISKWDTSNVDDMNSMFKGSKFNGNISDWDTSNVRTMIEMFASSWFKGNIDSWYVKDNCNTTDMFKNSALENNKPKWYKRR